ncbi:MAG TPA: hypothetical protein VE621_12950, partial [Bryobacteraceae bacterium]|nr:hypothetical protein [Bryobacteraceae bacterium]
TRSTKQLREGILEPSARIAEGYRPVRIVTAKGEKLEGVARNYTNYSLQMIDKTGKLHLFDTRELKQMEIDNSRSPMPADYATKLSATEVDNIIAFLARQSARSTRPKLPMQTTRRSR